MNASRLSVRPWVRVALEFGRARGSMLEYRRSRRARSFAWSAAFLGLSGALGVFACLRFGLGFLSGRVLLSTLAYGFCLLTPLELNAVLKAPRDLGERLERLRGRPSLWLSRAIGISTLLLRQHLLAFVPAALVLALAVGLERSWTGLAYFGASGLAVSTCLALVASWAERSVRHPRLFLIALLFVPLLASTPELPIPNLISFVVTLLERAENSLFVAL